MKPTELENKPPFRPVRLLLLVLAVILGISWMARWYGGSVIMPRYCEDPAQTLTNVHRLLTELRPAGDGDRKPYIIAARLTFLVPRESNESLPAYLDRLQRHLDHQCR